MSCFVRWEAVVWGLVGHYCLGLFLWVAGWLTMLWGWEASSKKSSTGTTFLLSYLNSVWLIHMTPATASIRHLCPAETSYSTAWEIPKWPHREWLLLCLSFFFYFCMFRGCLWFLCLLFFQRACVTGSCVSHKMFCRWKKAVCDTRRTHGFNWPLARSLCFSCSIVRSSKAFLTEREARTCYPCGWYIA